MPYVAVLCRNHDGRITLEDLYQLEAFCREKGAHYQTFEQPAQLQALCTVRLWRDLNTPDGNEIFTNWYVW